MPMWAHPCSRSSTQAHGGFLPATASVEAKTHAARHCMSRSISWSTLIDDLTESSIASAEVCLPGGRELSPEGSQPSTARSTGYISRLDFRFVFASLIPTLNSFVSAPPLSPLSAKKDIHACQSFRPSRYLPDDPGRTRVLSRTIGWKFA